MRSRLPFASIALLVVLNAPAFAAQPSTRPATRGDRMIEQYFRLQTAAIADRGLAEIASVEDWNAHRETYRRQLAEMLGLWPMPEKTDLKPTITGRIEQPTYFIEKLHFQSRPGLYVTANLYVPKNLDKPGPAIVYVCGHAVVKDKDTGVSYGNKTFYQHHAIWFAQNGYVCLVPDTLQLGEIEGVHHGLYGGSFAKQQMWWWLCRGYTPAGVEAWNGIRCLDYLQTRPEVDGQRIGMTGRSGGGAYSWWTTALDDRVKAAVPVAGITDLQNHVVDGAVEGHCDCMYLVNTYRWDYPQVAALLAPRPLLISNSDKDYIFPLDGVQRLHAKVRKVYELQKAGAKLGLLITEGPHKDTQDLQVPAFRWFNRFLKGEENSVVGPTPAKMFEPAQLQVFTAGLPYEPLNKKVHDTFVPKAPAPQVPESPEAWRKQRDGWMAALREKTFGGWPVEAPPLHLKEAWSAAHDGVRLRAYDFTSQEAIRLRLYVTAPEKLEKPELVVLNVLDEQGWKQWLAEMRPAFEKELAGEVESTGSPLPAGDEKAFAESKRMFASRKWVMAHVAPRGVGPTAWNADPKKDTHIQRRFWLLGQTADGMRVWDTRRAAQALRSVEGLSAVPLWLQGERAAAGIALYASLFEPDVARLDLWNLPPSHESPHGPFLLNVTKTLDTPAAVAMAAERSQVRIYQEKQDGWEYAAEVAKKLGLPDDRVQVRAAPKE
jgi:dienelactone hydrolase